LFSLLQRDDKGFAHPERIQKLVKNYSQFVSFPIYTWQEKGYTKEVSFLSYFNFLFSLILSKIIATNLILHIYLLFLVLLKVEVDEDPAEAKKDEQDDTTEV
jgi:heat shock protein beta